MNTPNDALEAALETALIARDAAYRDAADAQTTAANVGAYDACDAYDAAVSAAADALEAALEAALIARDVALDARDALDALDAIDDARIALDALDAYRKNNR